MPTNISAKTWRARAQTPEGRELAEKLAGDRSWSRDTVVRAYAMGVRVAVDHEKAFAIVALDDFGLSSRNAAAAAAIVGDVKAAMLGRHRARSR